MKMNKDFKDSKIKEDNKFKDNKFKEIERKFLVKYLPDLSKIKNLEKNYIKQAYISTSPLLRIRQKNDQYFFTYKSKGSIERVEVEEEITKEEFLNLWNKIEGYPIIKTRYTFPIGEVEVMGEDGESIEILEKKDININNFNNINNIIVELDIYEEYHKGFKNIEIEFCNLEDANAFIPPNWFGEDVTENFLYTNASMSKNKII